MTIPGSVFAAMLTPMRDTGEVAPERLGPLVDFILSRGVHGFYAGGSTGESMMQSTAERREILSGLADVAKGRATLIAHVGAASTGEAAELAAHARTLGYDAVSAVPPYYYRHGFEAIRDYYKAIADAAGLPVVIYNIPALSGTDLGTDGLLTLLSDPGIAGVKYTAQDLFQFGELRKAAPESLFYFGTDEMFLAASACGTDGGIGSTYNLIGDSYVGIEEAVAKGDIEGARAIQRRANDLIAILIRVGVVPGLKHALNRMGLPLGPCRAPMLALSEAQKAELDTWLDANGYTPGSAA